MKQRTHNRRISVLTALVIVLSGCASGLSKDECQVADWRAIGYEDGVQGWSQARISKHRKACAKHSVALDLDAYRSGWDEGVQRYCKPANGYRQGRSGIRYDAVCPSNLEPAFLQAYRHGRELYNLEAAVQKTHRTLNAKRNRLAEIETTMRDKGVDLVAADISTAQRIILLDDIRKLEEQRATTSAEIPALEEELYYQEQRLSAVSAENVY